MSTEKRTVQQCADYPGGLLSAEQIMKLTGFGQLLAGMAKPTVDATERTVTTHVHVMADANGNAQYGWILSVEATTGGTTGPCSIVSGAPNTTEVQVAYDATTGRPTLTFAAGDAVTGCKVHWVNTGTYESRSLASNLAQSIGVG